MWTVQYTNVQNILLMYERVIYVDKLMKTYIYCLYLTSAEKMIKKYMNNTITRLIWLLLFIQQIHRTCELKHYCKYIHLQKRRALHYTTTLYYLHSCLLIRITILQHRLVSGIK